MAKKRRLKVASQSADSSSNRPDEKRPSGVENRGAARLFSLPTFAVAMLAAVIVYVAYHPSDSTQVESGDALWFCVMGLVVTTITWTLMGWYQKESGVSCSWSDPYRLRPCDRIIDAAAWLMAGWMMVAALATCPPGNLRLATNEAWLWIAGAGLFTSGRCWCALPAVSRGSMGLLLACSAGVAVHAMHQDWVSLPAERAMYLADPEAALRTIGIDAPPGSGQRMLVENRLFDGGPTATFALANSMAGVVLVGCLIAIGLLRTQWHRMTAGQKYGLVMIALVCFSGLLAARSRSALAALVVAAVAVWMLGRDQPVNESGDTSADSGEKDPASGSFGRKPIVFIGLVTTMLSAVSLAVLVFGRKEWAEQAPASLAFRLQYWRATMRMAAEHPVFGVGPGNFKSQYLRYREAGAGEAIADPHNFVFETIAAGGFVALALLVVLVATVVWVALSRTLHTRTKNHDERFCDGADRPRWGDAWWMGALVSLVLVWLFGLMIGSTPDWGAHVFAIPTAIAGAWLVIRISSQLSFLCLRRVCAVAAAGLAIHLCASGGWTIPGVAVVLWILVAIVCRRPDGWVAGDRVTDHEPETNQRSRKIWAAVGLSSGLGLLMLLRTTALVPVSDARSAVLRAQNAQTAVAADAAIERAVLADPWAADLALMRCDMLHWRAIASDELVRGESSPRAKWLESIEAAKIVGGEDSELYRQMANQALHLYQRHAEQADLELSAQLIAQAIKYSPTDQSLLAQSAAILAQLGDQAESRKRAADAKELAILGNDVVRDLERVFILVAQPSPLAAQNGLIRRPASEVLANQLAEESVE